MKVVHPKTLRLILDAINPRTGKLPYYVNIRLREASNPQYRAEMEKARRELRKLRDEMVFEGLHDQLRSLIQESKLTADLFYKDDVSNGDPIAKGKLRTQIQKLEITANQIESRLNK